MATQLSSMAQFTAYARSSLRSIARIVFKRLQRTSSIVTEEYDQGHWAKVLQARDWERYSSVEEFLLVGKSGQMTAKVDGAPAHVAASEYYPRRDKAFAAMIDREFSDCGEIVEIGSGVGYNLLALANALPGRNFRGVDISPQGVAAARAIAQHFGFSDRMKFDLLDITDRNAANLGLLKDAGCFTFFCIEQIPGDVSAAIENIKAARPRRVLHVEPAGWLFDRPLKLADIANALYVISVHYQTKLFSTLERLNADGAIRLLRTERFAFAPTIQNDGFVAIWEPGRQ